MNALERDYKSMLLADRDPPCLSLYQPSHRSHPENQQDPIRFRNLVREMENSLQQKYTKREIAPILSPLHDLAEDTRFWNRTLDGLAVFAAPGFFRFYKLQRPVRELAIVADSFHTKPLIRVMQSADRYHVLGLNQHEACLFDGNRYTLDRVEPFSGVPETVSEVIGKQERDPEQKRRAYGPRGPATTVHGTDVRQAAIDADTERFFRAVDDAMLEHYSRPSGMPLLLAALPEHHHLFRQVSRNPYLMADAINTYPVTLPLHQLRERAWQIILPRYLERLSGIIEQFGAAKANGYGSADIPQIAKAAVAGRVASLLVEADREVPGHFDSVTGAVDFAPLDDPRVDDLLDDISEHVLRTDGDVVIVPIERMPTETGIAAIYRY